MSAEILREAARLMRENANAAICPCSGPVCNIEKGRFHEGELRARFEDVPGDSVPHVLAWHPSVALAVADWLESEAGYVERHAPSDLTTGHALAVALAYLNEVQS